MSICLHCSGVAAQCQSGSLKPQTCLRKCFNLDEVKLRLQVYLHGKALSTASICTAEGFLALMFSQYVILQVEATSELFATPLSGAQQHLPLPRVDMQRMLA